MVMEGKGHQVMCQQMGYFVDMEALDEIKKEISKGKTLVIKEQ